MKKLLIASAAALMIAGCGEDPDVTANELPAITDPADVAPEMAQADAPVGPNAGWDMDADMMIDRNEFTGVNDDGFLAWDDDANRELTEAEFDAGWTEAGFREGPEVFGLFDDNEDEILTEDEFFTDDEFAEWDVNDNDVLEREEFRYYAM